MQLPPLPPGFNVDSLYPSLRKWLFFNHSGVSPMSTRAADAMRHYTQQSQEDAYLTGKWYKQADGVRASAAKLINADPSEIAFIKNTSEGLAFVSNGLQWDAGDEIIGTGVEYPANVYPWMDVAQRFGVKYVMVPERNGAISLDELFAAVTPRTKMIALSMVQYASGFRSNYHAVGTFCRERGILFCADTIQGCGAIPVDVRAMNIDFLANGGHKWLMGPEGAGIFYCRKDLIPSVHPEVGSMNVINATDYGNYDFTLRNDSKRFECGGLNIAGILALGAAIDLLLEVGIDNVWQRVYALTQTLAHGLTEKGYKVISPRENEDQCSGIVCFTSPKHNHAELLGKLMEKHIVLVEREKRLRAAPHFYQDFSHIRRLLEALPSH